MQTYDFQGDCVEIDVFNPETRKYVWDVCKKNYYDYGINAFWLDNSEPDYGVYDFDHYRYIEGPALSCSNIYPQLYSRVFHDKKKKSDRVKPVGFFRINFHYRTVFVHFFLDETGNNRYTIMYNCN